MNYWQLYKLYGNIDFRWAHFNKVPYKYPFKTLNDTDLTGFIAGKESLHLIGNNITVYNSPINYNEDPTASFTGLSLVHKDYVDSLGGGGGGTNLTYFGKNDSGDILSDTGTDATIPGATTSVAGLLTADDKLKLDGIEAGATADQDASEVSYDNTSSSLTATNVQDAIDEVEDRIDTLESTSSFSNTAFSVAKTTDQATTSSFADITTWDTAHLTTSDISFDTSTGVVTINTAGTYLIIADFSYAPSFAVAVTCSTKMVEDTGSGYTDVPGTLRREGLGDTSMSVGTSMASVTISYVKT